jgi:hypothetical protein
MFQIVLRVSLSSLVDDPSQARWNIEGADPQELEDVGNAGAQAGLFDPQVSQILRSRFLNWSP